MWDLEYLLLFGLPGNKWELWDGVMHCRFPFRERAAAEAHWELWIETLCRWQAVNERPRVERKQGTWEAAVGDFSLTLFRQPMNLDVPIDADSLERIYDACWRRDFWDQQPPGYETGFDSPSVHGEIKMNLWTLLRQLSGKYGGRASCVDIALSETAAVAPDIYYYSKPSDECMIGRDYFRGVPDLVGEVLSAGTRGWDRGPRMEVYRRAGVRHILLVEPAMETVEVYELDSGQYARRGVYGAGSEFRLPLFPYESLSVDVVFDTQDKRWPQHRADEADEAEPIPDWILPPDRRLGLEHLFLLGHPDRRYEIWNNRVPCQLSFGSPAEAELRYRHFLKEIGRWECLAGVKSSEMAPNQETAEAGRFRLTRDGRRVQLDVAVDARKYQDLLAIWSGREGWDWGDK